MTWIRVDSAFPGHPKVLDLEPDCSNAAVGLFTLCLCYADAHRTDGHVPAKALRIITADPEWATHAAELVRVGLWHEAADGFQIHDYLAWQRSAAEIDAQSERQRVKARKRWQDAASDASGTTNGSASGNADQTRREERDKTTPQSPPDGGGGVDVEWIRALSGHSLSVVDVLALVERYGIDAVTSEADRLAAEQNAGQTVKSWSGLLEYRLKSRPATPTTSDTPRQVSCPKCSGLGTVPDPATSDEVTCPECNGEKWVPHA